MKSPPVAMGAELPGPIHCTVGVPVTPLTTLTLQVRVYDCPSVGFPLAVIDTSTVQKGTHTRFDNTVDREIFVVKNISSVAYNDKN